MAAAYSIDLRKKSSDELVILVEASSKGLHSLIRTLQLVCKLKEVNAFTGSVLGPIAFRDKWIGRMQAKRSETSINEPPHSFWLNSQRSPPKNSLSAFTELWQGKALDSTNYRIVQY